MTTESFADRRKIYATTQGMERRQFGNTYAELNPDARELGEAIDRYKLINRRRYVTYEEMLQIIQDLGYVKG